MSNEPKPMITVAVNIPIYRENIEYGLEQNDIEVNDENVVKAAKMMAARIVKMEWYNNDELLFGDDAAAGIIEDNIDAF